MENGSGVLLSALPKGSKSWLALIAAVCAITFTAPSESSWSLSQVPAKDILVFQAADIALSRHVDSVNNPGNLAQYEPGMLPAPVQFHVPGPYVAPDQFYFVTGIDLPLRQFVGGSLSDVSQAERFFGIGFRKQFLTGPSEEIFARSDNRRVDFVGELTENQNQISAIFTGPIDQRGAAEQRYLDWQQQLTLAAVICGALSILCGLAGLVYGRNWTFYAGSVGVGTLYLIFVLPIWVPLLSGAMSNWLSVGLLAAGLLILMRGSRSRNGGWDSITITCSALLIAGAVGGFFLAALDQAGADYFITRHFLNLAAAPFVFVAVPRRLAFDARHLVQQLETSRRELGLRDAIIEEQEVELQNKIRKQAVLEERQRFVRDMHDGVGGNLLSLLMRVRTKRVDLEKVELELEDGLTDLRLVVDSMDQMGASLVQALAMFQSRASRQLEASDVAMDWSEEGDIAAPTFASREILNIYRIMQEAMTNALRHGKPRTIAFHVLARLDAGTMTITIADDGKGFDPAAIAAGRGLANMRKRAEQLGGNLTIEPRPDGTGTCVKLTLSVG